MKSNFIKLFGTSWTSVTNAWNFDDFRVNGASLLSLSITSFLTMLDGLSHKFVGVSGVLLLMIFIIVLTDFLTGITAAYQDQRRLRRKIICASKGIRSAYKLGVYIVFLFCIHSLIKEHVGTFIADILRYLHIYITIHIFFWESFSVDENMKKLGYDMGLTKTLKQVFNTLSSIKKKGNE